MGLVESVFASFVQSVGPRKHKFNRILQVVPLCLTTLRSELYENGWTDRFAIWVVDLGGLKEARVQSYSLGGANVRVDTAVSCKNSWTDPFAVWVVESGVLNEAHVQLHLQGDANVPSQEGTLAPPGEYDWTAHLWWGLMLHYFDRLFFFCGHWLLVSESWRKEPTPLLSGIW